MTETQYAVARKMWADGASMKSIAYKVGMTLKELASVTRSNRDDFPRRRNSTHLTDEQIASIHSLRAGGMTIKKVAETVGCSKSTVERLLRIARKQGQ